MNRADRSYGFLLTGLAFIAIGITAGAYAITGSPRNAAGAGALMFIALGLGVATAIIVKGRR